MKKKSIFGFITLFIIICAVTLDACRKADVSFTTPVALQVPAYFPPPLYDFTSHPLNAETIELGRYLFHEGRLSLDGHYPCASCHQQAAAFTTFEHDLSHGYNQSHTRRNAPALQNLAWLPSFNHDGGAGTLEHVIEQHITHPQYMAETIDGVLRKLNKDTLYNRLFTAAFGTQQATKGRMLAALKQFLLTFVSANSKYDDVKKGTSFFSAPEAAGYQIFQAKCAACHTEPLFTDNSFRNIGLPLNAFLQDYGRLGITANALDSFKFRVPSLRNVALTSYYAHDGRFGAVRTHIGHYRSGVVYSTTLDPLLIQGIALSNNEVDNLVAFLRTLTDSSFINNPAFTQP